MYILCSEYKGQKLSKDDSVLMSAEEFAGKGKDLKNVPVTVTPDGKEPVEPTVTDPIIEPEPTIEDKFITEIEQLKEQIRTFDSYDKLRAEMSKTELVKQ